MKEELNRRDFLALSGIAVVFSLTAKDVLGAATAAKEVAETAGKLRPAMREVSSGSIVTIAEDSYWYYGFTGVATTGKNVLVCSYLKTDQHLRTTTDIMIARSLDGGRTWQDHRSIAHLDIEKDEAIWVAPELNRLKDGRLILICDRGQRKVGQILPVLSEWQTKERGMSNWIFISEDAGVTWTKPYKTDDVGGEPGRVHELSNGAWMYTRTDSRPTDQIKHPVAPWGARYYRSTAVFSDDKGESFNRTSVLADGPLIGDCEVDLCEYEKGKIIAFTRVGDAGGRYGQPSRAVYSSDFGKTWSHPIVMPFYAHRPIPGLLKSGKLLVTYRNAWGTTASYAFVFDPKEKFLYQPNSFIWDESRCALKNGAMEIRTEDGSRNAVEFALYPVEDEDSAVEMNAEFAVKAAEQEGCLVSAGCWVRFLPNRIELADREGEGFAFDTTNFHSYRFVNRSNRLELYVDGKLKLQTGLDGIFTRYVHFGNRPGANPPVGTISAETNQSYTKPKTDGGSSPSTQPREPLRGVQYHRNSSLSLWKSVSAKVLNRRDHSIDWTWNARQGFPDQFRRDRIVLLERNGTFAVGDGGYSGWTQMDDGHIVVVDYTSGEAGKLPVRTRAYLLNEKDLA